MLFLKAPSRGDASRIQAIAEEHPGRLFEEGLKEMSRFLGAREGADPKDYITTAQDYMYRNKVISQNADICNFFFRKKVDLMIKYVLEKVIGLKLT